MLTIIFNWSLQIGDFTDDLRKGFIAPVFKESGRHKPSNYWPVSLTSICSKIIKHILVSNIRKHLERNSILLDEQHSFRTKRCCESQRLTCSQNLFEMSHGGQVVLDFSKAFDKVIQRRLMVKLSRYGIQETKKGSEQSIFVRSLALAQLYFVNWIGTRYISGGAGHASQCSK